MYLTLDQHHVGKSNDGPLSDRQLVIDHLVDDLEGGSSKNREINENRLGTYRPAGVVIFGSHVPQCQSR